MTIDPYRTRAAAGSSPANPLPSTGSSAYAGWVQHQQLDAAALTRRRDQRRLARALRRARRFRVLSDRARAQVARAESQIRDAVDLC